MTSRNSVSNAEGGDNCRTHHVLETAIEELNLKSDFNNTARCIHYSNRRDNLFQNQLQWTRKDKALIKSADSIPHLTQYPLLSSRSDRAGPVSDRSSVSAETYHTYAVQRIEQVAMTQESSECNYYMDPEPKYKNLTPFEIKLQKDIEAYQIAKREAFERWLRKKEEERRAKCKKKDKELYEIKIITSEEREEAFRKWCERKKQIERDEKQRKLIEKQRQEEEKLRDMEGKEQKHREWFKRKAMQQKEMKRRQKEAEQKLVKLKEIRKKENDEAYKQWLRQARHKPLPVPLNKGELSMKGSITKMYVNPEPWKNSAEASSSASNISD